MLTRFAGFFVGSVFGLAFVLINSGPPLPAAVSLTLRTLALMAAVAIVTLAVLAMRKGSRENSGETQTPTGGSGGKPTTPRFGVFFGVVTLIEFALIIGGAITIGNLPAVPDQAGVAWVALIVGLHFFPLAWYWKQREILVVGGYTTVLGAIGLVMTLAGYQDWVPLVSGVVTGAGFLLGPLVVLVLMHREHLAAPAGTP